MYSKSRKNKEKSLHPKPLRFLFSILCVPGLCVMCVISCTTHWLRKHLYSVVLATGSVQSKERKCLATKRRRQWWPSVAYKPFDLRPSSRQRQSMQRLKITLRISQEWKPARFVRLTLTQRLRMNIYWPTMPTFASSAKNAWTNISEAVMVLYSPPTKWVKKFAL